MRVQITARHCDVPESVKLRAEEQAAKLTKYEPRLSGVELVFHEEKTTKRVEGILSIDRRDPIVTSGEGSDFRPALDQLLDRASRMLRRQRQQVRDRQHSAGPTPASPTEA